ncbi:hypothetical protein QBC47DRAFT_392997 [Echria macrotheca]|uniref:Uncharacterized protein n=1 Tax=Echria macrotheca TaxID=438768 RepID=A0AAJ0B5V1_9PEZI|nr:hypothetical protein QBC47DRAFT_392997 [Echria macrotheca]
MTVKYDGGQAQRGKLQQVHDVPAQSLQSPQPQLPPPPPPPPQHQFEHQYALQTLHQQHHSQLPPPPRPSHAHHEPLPSLSHHHAHHAVPPAPHYPQHALPPRQPSLAPFSSQPAPPPVAHPPASLPPLHHALPPASSQPLPSVISKPIIMDPPGRRTSQPPTPPKGFPSPSQDHARVNPKFVDDCTRITFAVQQSVPEAVRRTVRDNWEKCLLGSEFHQAFVLNASIHHATTSITRRAVRDFGAKMVQESREEVMEHFTEQDLDAVVDQILAKASDQFLDRCLEKRLYTIEAKPLINALATAKRLGYNPSDIVQEDHEHVIPREAFPGAGVSTAPGQVQQHHSSRAPTSSVVTATNPALQCRRCFRTFIHTPPYDYHTKYNLCQAVPPTAEGFKQSCAACGQQFMTTDELQAHLDTRICSTYVSKPPRGPGRPPRQPPAAQPTSPIAIYPSIQRPGPGVNGYQSPQPQPQLHSTPGPSQPAVRRSIGPGGSSTPSGSPNPDPYAHLSKADFDAMNEELHAAEEKYAPRFKEAELIPDENERRAKIEGLRNSFGTKQSMIRKKYGVRLRERRTKAEIQAEKERLGIRRAEREKAKAALTATPANPGSAAQPGSVPARSSGASGWVAANTPRATAWEEEHDAKRRRMEGGEYEAVRKSAPDETPTRKPLSVTEMGGSLSNSTNASATGSAVPQPSAPKVDDTPARGAQARPTSAQGESTSERPSPSSTDTHSGETRDATGSVSDKRPIPVDDSSSSSDDDEGIPPSLPPHIRQSLTPQKPAGSTAAPS